MMHTDTESECLLEVLVSNLLNFVLKLVMVAFNERSPTHSIVLTKTDEVKCC